jgi:hypothetical protein
MEPVFIGCKNTRSVYYIRFFQEKRPKNELKKSDRQKKNNSRWLKATTQDFSGIRFAYYTSRDYENLVGVKMASRVGGDYAVIRYVLL